MHCADLDAKGSKCPEHLVDVFGLKQEKTPLSQMRENCDIGDRPRRIDHEYLGGFLVLAQLTAPGLRD